MNLFTDPALNDIACHHDAVWDTGGSWAAVAIVLGICVALVGVLFLYARIRDLIPK